MNYNNETGLIEFGKDDEPCEADLVEADLQGAVLHYARLHGDKATMEYVNALLQ